ncbi:FtsQ-type POTRA domain-containing protein [bacterium]|nr:FtsQ-type POTRA domain-containing protein [bacterium]
MRVKKGRQSWVENRKRKKEKEKRSVFFRMAFYFLLIAFAGVTVYIFMFSPFLQINYVELRGVEELEYEKVSKELSCLLDGKYLGFISRNNFILISERKIKNHLTEKFKKISEVEVEKKFPDTVKVRIVERKSLLLWCSGGPCYIIDEKGRAYSGADFESPEIKENNLIRLEDASAKPVNLGEKVLGEDYINFILELTEEIKKEALADISGEYQTACRAAEDVRIKTAAGWDIYFSSKVPAKQSARTLKTFLEKEMGEEKRKNLEYVDLRVENKVYYKFKDLGENKND